MQTNGEQARARFAGARVGYLATVDKSGHPHLVPIVFTLLENTLYFVVDAKPKSTTRLKRLHNIRGNPHVSVLVDHYDEDWNQLWWARADGTASVLDEIAPDAMSALAERYPQYQEWPPGPMVAIAVHSWSGWSARG